MFDFLRWRDWLKAGAKELNDAGFVAEWRSNDKYLRGTSVEATGKDRLGSFRNFENGLVDYEVFDVLAHRFIANETMISVNDQNFAGVFRRFSEILQKPV